MSKRQLESLERDEAQVRTPAPWGRGDRSSSVGRSPPGGVILEDEVGEHPLLQRVA